MAESNREEIAKLGMIYANNPGGRVFTHLAEAYRKAGELDHARAILENGIGRHPDYASAHVVLGRVLMDQGAQEQAAGSFRRVLELDPENRVALRTMGDLARRVDPKEALGHYRQLQSLDPSDEDLSELINSLDEQVQQAAATLAQEQARVETAPPAETAATSEPGDATASALEEVGTGELERTAVKTEAAVTDSTADWSVAEAELSEELPGDLGELAREPEPQPTEPEPPAVQESAEPVSAEYPISETEAVEPAAIEAMDSVETELWVPEIPEQIGPLDAIPVETEGEGLWFSDVDLTAGPVDAPPESPVSAPEGSSDSEFSADLQGVVPGAPGEETSSFESFLSASLTDASEQADPGEDLPTETLAELYRTQGFYDRSAEVYRALLQRRPNDPRLTQRLHEVEELERSATVEPVSGLAFEAPPDLAVFRVAPPADEPVIAEPHSAGVSPAWVEDVESAWTGGGGVAEVQDSPYAWELDQDEENSGPSLADYLSGVLAWRPSMPATPEEPAVSIEELLPLEDEGPEAIASAESLEVSMEAPIVVEGGSWADDEEPWSEPTQHASEDESDPWGAVTAEAEEARPLFGEPAEPSLPEEPDHDPWPGLPVEPMDPWAEVEVPPASAEPALGGSADNAVEDAFEEWFTSSPEGSVQVSPAPVESPTGTAPPVAPAPAAEADEDESDDDLEMFRSWLQSLKR